MNQYSAIQKKAPIFRNVRSYMFRMIAVSDEWLDNEKKFYLSTVA
jgi:hypothetical protein